MGMTGFMTGWMALWGLLVLALLVLAVVGSVWLIKSLTSGRSAVAPSHQDELGRRYAAGEIDREDYLRRKQDLTQK